MSVLSLLFLFFHDPATTENYTLSLHDALPISARKARPTPKGSAKFPPRLTRTWRGAYRSGSSSRRWPSRCAKIRWFGGTPGDRKSTRLNSSHMSISYAVFCLKKKNETHDFL